MNSCKILIVDDSAVYRSHIRHAFEGFSDIEVVGTAGNGSAALQILGTRHVDLVISDLEMPQMDGLELLRQIKVRDYTCKVLVFSSHTKAGADTTLRALSLGAVDFLLKPTATEPGQAPTDLIRAALLPKVLQFGKVEVKREVPAATVVAPKPNLLFFPKAVVIASSTGGPSALESLFSRMIAPLTCPIFIVQHMPPMFTALLAERLSKISGLNVTEAMHGEPVAKGRVYIAPGDSHLRLVMENQMITTALDQGPQRNSVRPAADFLFESAAKLYGQHLLSVVLTGMGMDGKDGATAVKGGGGQVWIQNRQSSVVYGMPGAVFDSGNYDQVYNLEEMTTALQEYGIIPGLKKVG